LSENNVKPVDGPRQGPTENWSRSNYLTRINSLVIPGERQKLPGEEATARQGETSRKRRDKELTVTKGKGPKENEGISPLPQREKDFTKAGWEDANFGQAM